MIIYKISSSATKSEENSPISLNDSRRTIKEVNVNFENIDLSKDNNEVIDYDYMNNLYGFPISEVEVQIYLAHKNIWNLFLK
ncbi:hypothetical protein DBR11_25890 [Pedobacter sp. HMWF019]|nr:hypothetical protein DBR11_25890 [Pedobacter sp. HMWF019]